jgi:transcriptional regulator with XRE-family HTH domain
MTEAPTLEQLETLAAVGRRLREWRRFRRRTQSEVAAAVGITQASVSNYELGRRDPGISTLLGVAEYLEVPPGDLLTGLPPVPAEEGRTRSRSARLVLTRPQLLAALEEFVSHWGMPEESPLAQ